MTKVARPEKYSILFRIVYPFIEQKYLHFPFFEQTAGGAAVQSQVRQQQSERLVQRKTAFYDLLL